VYVCVSVGLCICVDSNMLVHLDIAYVKFKSHGHNLVKVHSQWNKKNLEIAGVANSCSKTDWNSKL